MTSPQNKARKVPITKKGAKGTSVFKFFPFKAINPTPIIAPIKKDKNRASNILGKPTSKPKKKANFTSPKPSHLPLERRKMAKKKMVAPTAAGRKLKINLSKPNI